MNTPTLTKPRRCLVAIGRTANGGSFAIAPADWPTESEIAEISRINDYARAIRSLMDPADYRRYRKMCKRSNL